MLLLYNGRIRTLSPDQPEASALLINRGIITAVGGEEITASGPAGTRKEDLGGQIVWPGLTDAHLHLVHYSRALKRVDCETATKQECLERVRQHAGQLPEDAWVLGHGWNQNMWPEGFGNADELEQATGGRPAFLTDKSIHAGWANRSALRLAGITRGTPDPDGGLIQRDDRGEPTGILKEAAVELIYQVLPEPTLAETTAGIEAAQQHLWRAGLTGVHDFDGPACFAALQMLDAEERLKLRVVKSIPLELLDQAARLGLRSGFGSDFLRIGSVKMFADGALGPQTAAMLQPYEGQAGNAGVLLLDAEQVLEHSQQAVRSGLSVAIHSIGDRANHEVINGLEQLRSYERQESLPALRHRIEHVQVLHPQDRSRLARSGLIASMQPIHTTSDMDTADRYWGSRSSLAYAFRTLLDEGTHLAFGSDAPVESPNPFWGLHAAVTRRRQTGYPGEEGWYPEQRLALGEALAAYTTGPAYASGQERRLGRLAAGFAADIILLAEDPFTVEPQQLSSIQPTATMVAGEWVWR